jgi:hypothetical protein
MIQFESNIGGLDIKTGVMSNRGSKDGKLPDEKMVLGLGSPKDLTRL